MAKPELEAFIAKHGITLSATFVPQSKSRNAKPIKSPTDLSLNWRVTIAKDGRTVTTDYMQGIAHAPGYRQSFNGRMTVPAFEELKFAAEHGYTGTWSDGMNACRRGKPLPAPELCDVLYCLSLDSSVIDHSNFESWADEYGYDTDSCKAEATYKECLEIALEMRAMLGDSLMAELQDACHDY